MKSLFCSEKRQEPSVHYQMNQGGGQLVMGPRRTLIFHSKKVFVCCFATTYHPLHVRINKLAAPPNKTHSKFAACYLSVQPS